MEKKSPQLSLDELLQLKWLLGGVLTLLAAWTAFYLDIEAVWPVAITTAGVLLGLARPDWLARVPRLAHRLAFPGIVAFFVGDLWLTGEVLPAMVRLDMLLLLYRGITYRKRRDDLQVIVLGLFLIVVAGVLTVSLAFAVQILAFTACALGFLLTITLAEAAGAGVAEAGNTPRRSAPPLSRGDHEAEGVPSWAQADWRRLLRRVREVTDWRVVALGGGLFAGVVAVSALLFLAIPRFQLENSLFLERFMSKKAKTGFNDTVRFGEVSEIQQDNSVALSVDVSDRSKIPATPYWRMLVLDEYRDGTFRLSAGLRRAAFPVERTEALLRGAGRPRLGEQVYWTFYLESGVSRYLPLLGAFELLRFREPQNFRYGHDLGVMALRNEPVTMTAYRVEGMDTGGSVADAPFAARFAEGAANLRAAGALFLRTGTEGADRAVLTRIVDEIGGGAKLSAAEFERRAVAWLRGRHAYSLQPKVPAGSGDALVRWLASGEPGHCELFAGSLILLARTAGWPARLAVGFRGGTWNGYSNNFTIRNSDAHAWCEVFDPAAGAWVRADPTPGAANALADDAKGEAALAAREDRSWSARFDSLRIFWYRRIVNFDQRTQVETLKAVKEATTNTSRRLRESLERALVALKAWLQEPWDARRVAKGLAVLAALAGAAWAAVHFRFSLRDFRRGARRRGDPVREEAGRWLRKLAEWPAAESAGAGVTGELQRLRFGDPRTWPEPRPVFLRARRAWREARKMSGRRMAG
jgi:hypothetical protein